LHIVQHAKGIDYFVARTRTSRLRRTASGE
jgi:hypothetical protein